MKSVLYLVLAVLLSCSSALARDYYVATNGNDANPGTIDKPFATLERARDVNRRISPHESIHVYLRQGRYFRTGTFDLTAEDSGATDQAVVYQAYRGEAVRLIGARQVPADAFTVVSSRDSAWGRLDPAARGKCLKANLNELGITIYGQALDIELSFNGKLMQLARWPNDGFVLTTSAKNDIQFGYEGNRPNQWIKAPDAYAMGYWRYGWANRIERIAKIDTAAREITLAKSPGYGIQAKKPYYVLNLLEEIDRPGEWYLDRQTGVLYFWPPADVVSEDVLLSTLTEPIISMKDVSHLSIDGLTIEMGAGDGIKISGGRGNLVKDCTIRNIRKNGIILSGTGHSVERCEINGIGQMGISVSGGDRKTLEPGKNSVRNCRIHDFGRWQRTYAPAIRLNGVGNIAANNLLYDAPHSAILFGGNEHLIELNEIHDVCYEVDDAGSVYTGRDWGSRGNLIRNNFFHHIKSHLPGGNGVHAVYLDDCASGITVQGNVFYEISGRAIMCGGGRDNTIDNNVIAKCGSAHFTDRRARAWLDKDSSWKLLDKIKRYNYTQPPWSDRYPRLAHILDNGYDRAKEPEGCVISRNIGWKNKRWLEKNGLGGRGGFDFYTFKDNIEDRDPHFVNEASLNLALQDDSPAYSIPGFKRIPFDKIGPQDD